MGLPSSYLSSSWRHAHFSASGFIPFVRAEILDTELEYSIHVSFSIDLDLGLDSCSRAGIDDSRSRAGNVSRSRAGIKS